MMEGNSEKKEMDCLGMLQFDHEVNLDLYNLEFELMHCQYLMAVADCSRDSTQMDVAFGVDFELVPENYA